MTRSRFFVSFRAEDRWAALSAALLLAWFAIPSAAQNFYSSRVGATETCTTLTIKPDGSCVLSKQTVEPRWIAEQQVRNWERYAKMAEGEAAVDAQVEEASPGEAQNAEPKPLTDAELTAKIRQTHGRSFGGEEDNPEKIEGIELTTNSVRVLSSRPFASLKDLLSQSPWLWGPEFLMLEAARLELGTNHDLVLTFAPSKQAALYSRNTARQWKSSKTKNTWKLVLPGKILGSGLPQTQGNSTWIDLQGENEDSVVAALKLVGTPLVISAELAGLTLDAPLDSSKLVRRARHPSAAGDELPITDAGPGFEVEPLSVTVSTCHRFPEGETLLKARPEAAALASESPGTVIAAKLFPPPGRTIKSITGLKVTKAIDDKGRPVPLPAESNGVGDRVSFFVGYGSERVASARLDLRLGLPAPDARAIEQLQAETVALTVGSWKEMLLTNVQADAKQTLDLGEVLPGAKLVVEKLTRDLHQTTMAARLEGPAGIRHIELRVKSRTPGANSNTSERPDVGSAAQKVRRLTLYTYEAGFGPGDSSAPTNAVTLIVRFPQDIRRERVQFKLAALDLF